MVNVKHMVHALTMATAKTAIRKARAQPLSNEDILQAVGGKTNLVLYSDLANYRSIDDVLGPYRCCVILYGDQLNCGHWCCLLDPNWPKRKGRKRDKVLEFFDPYGTAIDEESNREGPRVLTRLVADGGYDLLYNDHDLQAESPGTNTCGRWVIARILLRHIPIDQFCKMFEGKGVPPDDIVTAMTIGV